MTQNNAEKGDKFVSFSELMAKELPPIRWLIDGLVPEEGTVVLAGMSGSYKTWLVMSMAIAVSTGQDFLDVFNTCQTGVLIIDEESGERLYSERFKLLTDQGNLKIYLLSMCGFVVNNDNIENTIKFCEKEGIGLVIIDSMTRVHTGDENTSKDVSKFFALLKRFNKRGISTLVIHHNRKPGQGGYDASSDMRGSSDIRAAVDVQLAIRRVGESSSIEVRQPKCRYGVENKPFGLNFCEDSETGKMKFVYSGDIKGGRDDVSEKEKIAKLRGAIVKAVSRFPGANKGTIAVAVTNETKIGVSRTKAEIATMIEEGALVANTGKHNATLLSLPDNPNNFEEEAS